jgi:hypothetical protein
LGRKDSELTSQTGYAGGSAIGKEGQVCYHNMQSVADYGRLGHGEVVGMSIPAEEIVPFTEYYFSLFNPRTKGEKQRHRNEAYTRLVARLWALVVATNHSHFPLKFLDIHRTRGSRGSWRRVSFARWSPRWNTACSLPGHGGDGKDGRFYSCPW